MLPSPIAIRTWAFVALGRPVAGAGQPAHTDRRAALGKRREGDRESLELHEAAGGLRVRATRYRDRANGLVCAWRVSGSRGWTAEDRSLLDNIAGQVGLAIEQIGRASCRERVCQYV